MFTDAQLQYLSSQILGRLATVGPDGPQGGPSASRSTPTPASSRSAGTTCRTRASGRTCASDGRVAFVVDDLPSTDPWRPRALEVRGTAEALAVADGDDRDVIRIRPERVLSMGIDT